MLVVGGLECLAKLRGRTASVDVMKRVRELFPLIANRVDGKMEERAERNQTG